MKLIGDLPVMMNTLLALQWVSDLPVMMNTLLALQWVSDLPVMMNTLLALQWVLDLPVMMNTLLALQWVSDLPFRSLPFSSHHQGQYLILLVLSFLLLQRSVRHSFEPAASQMPLDIDLHLTTCLRRFRASGFPHWFSGYSYIIIFFSF